MSRLNRGAPVPVLGAIAGLMTGYLILITGNTLLTSLTALQLLVHGSHDAISGLVHAAYYVGFVGGAIFGRDMVRNLGHHRAFTLIVVTMAVTVWLQSRVFQPWLWLGYRMVCGALLFGIFMIVESWLNDAAPNNQRSRILSLYMITSYLGAAGGQLLLLWIPTTSPWAYTLASGLFLCAALPVWLASPQGGARYTRAGSGGGASLQRLWQSLWLVVCQSPAAMTAILVSGMLNSAFYTLMPVFLVRSGYTEPAALRMMAWSMLSALLLQWPLGMLADRLGRRLVLWGLSLSVASVAGAIFLLGSHAVVPWLILLYVSMAFCIYGVANAMVNDAVPAAMRVEVSAVLLLTFAGGGLLGPVVVSSAMSWWGSAAYFLCLMLTCLLLPLALGCTSRQAAAPGLGKRG